jgi:hypothetical protein
MEVAMKATKIMIVLFTAMFFVVGSAWADNISYDIPEKAELTKLSMYMKKIRSKSDQKAVVFEVEIKNNDTAEHMYSVTVVMPEAAGAEGFIPAKGDVGVAPGESGSTAIGIIWPEFPKMGYTIMVREITER